MPFAPPSLPPSLPPSSSPFFEASARMSLISISCVRSSPVTWSILSSLEAAGREGRREGRRAGGRVRKAECIMCARASFRSRSAAVIDCCGSPLLPSFLASLPLCLPEQINIVEPFLRPNVCQQIRVPFRLLLGRRAGTTGVPRGRKERERDGGSIVVSEGIGVWCDVCPLPRPPPPSLPPFLASDLGGRHEHDGDGDEGVEGETRGESHAVAVRGTAGQDDQDLREGERAGGREGGREGGFSG